MFLNFSDDKKDVFYDHMTEGKFDMDSIPPELLERILGDSEETPSEEILKFKKFLYEDCMF